MVTASDNVKQVLRLDMISHLSDLDEILLNLSNRNIDAAEEVAESSLGKNSMGRHRGAGMKTGHFMPQEMHNIAFSMHHTADNFAELTKKKNGLKEIYVALQVITSHCVAWLGLSASVCIFQRINLLMINGRYLYISRKAVFN